MQTCKMKKMQPQKVLVLFLSLCLLIVLGGCRSQQVYNAVNRDIIPTSAGAVTEQKVRTGIDRACEGMGWEIEEVQPGLLLATLTQGEQTAKVNIQYSVSSYSIMYFDSKGFDYKNGEIEGAYNDWIHVLERAIITQISMAR